MTVANGPAASQLVRAVLRSAEPGLAHANHRGPYHPPTLPTRLPHISAGEQEFEEWNRAKWGGSKKGTWV